MDDNVTTLKKSKPNFALIHFERLTLPVLNHVLAAIDAAGLSLAVTDLDHWLETSVPANIDLFAPRLSLSPPKPSGPRRGVTRNAQ